MYDVLSVKSQQPSSVGLVAVRAGGAAAGGRHTLVPHPRRPGADLGQGENSDQLYRAVNEVSRSLETTPSAHLEYILALDSSNVKRRP